MAIEVMQYQEEFLHAKDTDSVLILVVGVQFWENFFLIEQAHAEQNQIPH